MMSLVVVVEAYRLDRYDNCGTILDHWENIVVEAYRLDRYDNIDIVCGQRRYIVVEAYRLDRYDNFILCLSCGSVLGCRSLSFG